MTDDVKKIIVDLRNEPDQKVTVRTGTFIPNESDLPKGIINAKGDIIIGDENAQPVRLPIGDPEYFLMVDPTQDRGYKFTKTLDGGTF